MPQRFLPLSISIMSLLNMPSIHTSCHYLASHTQEKAFRICACGKTSTKLRSWHSAFKYRISSLLLVKCQINHSSLTFPFKSNVFFMSFEKCSHDDKAAIERLLIEMRKKSWWASFFSRHGELFKLWSSIIPALINYWSSWKSVCFHPAQAAGASSSGSV